MKLNFIRLAIAAALLAAVSGCATQPGKTGSGFNICTVIGAAVGGGGTAVIAAAAGPIGAGIFVGGLLGTLACTEGDPAPQPVAAAPTPPPPPPVPEPDSDGDGVIDRLDRCPGTPRGTKVDAYGCPDILMTLTGINFKFDSSAIEPDSERILNEAVQALNQASSVDVRIVGHTDSVGSDAYNEKLSHRRANAVRDYLVQHGISGGRLSTDGKGETMPVAPNDTDNGRYQNRRVELHVNRGGSQASTGSSSVYVSSGSYNPHHFTYSPPHSDSNKAAENWSNEDGPDDAPVAPTSETEMAAESWEKSR